MNRDRALRFTLGLWLAVALGGCASAETSSSPNGTIPSAGPSAFQSAAAPSSSGQAPTPTSTQAQPTATPEMTASPSPTLPPGAAGDLTHIDWQSVGFNGPAGSNIFGWSRGYVGFAYDFTANRITPWASSDGSTWTSGQKLDTSDFSAGLQAYRALIANDAQQGQDDSGMSCQLQVDNVAEGPASLVATSWLVCDGWCGSFWIGPAVWVTNDALSWDRVTPAQMGTTSQVSQEVGQGPRLPLIAGGPSGFVAITGDHSAVVSQDGRRWLKAAAVPIPSGAESVTLSSAADLDGSYVVAGSILIPHACGLVFGDDVVQAGIWSSATGMTWTRALLSPSLACVNAEVQLDRLNNHALLARETCDVASADPSAAQAYVAWTSTNARDWTTLSGAGLIQGYTFYTDGTVNVGYAPVMPNTVGDGAFCYFDAHLQPAGLTQTGAVPTVQLTIALGPAGVLATDGTHFWIGTLS